MQIMLSGKCSQRGRERVPLASSMNMCQTPWQFLPVETRMEATSPAGEPSDLKQLSDVELVRLLPVKEKGETRDAKDLSSQVRLALDELWERYRKQMERVLRAKIFSCGSTICPSEEPDKEHFL